MSRVIEISIKNTETKKRHMLEMYDFESVDVSFMSKELRDEIQSLTQVGLCMRRFKGDIVTEGIDYKSFSLGDILRIGDVEFEVTQVGKPCHSYECSAYDEHNECIMQKGVMFAWVKVPGKVKLLDQIIF